MIVVLPIAAFAVVVGGARVCVVPAVTESAPSAPLPSALGVQIPFVHASTALHVVPHAPQFAVSFSLSTHAPEQSEYPVEQPQVDAEHVALATHAVPAEPTPDTPQPDVAPQYELLLVGLTQLPPQLTRPAWQESWHVLLEQTNPGAHAVPALPTPLVPHPVVAPQKDRLLLGSTQVPPQLTWPA